MKTTVFDAAGLGGRLIVLAGGNSAEREISLKSGAAVQEALAALAIDAELIDVSGDYISQLVSARPAFAFIAVHGRGGEDGVLQAVLESLAIPYSGSGVLASALAMDKVASKLMWRGAGVPTAPFHATSLDGDLANEDQARLLADFSGAVFVKPASEGSSFGMSCVSDVRDLSAAIEKAQRYDSNVLIEQFIDGPEYTVPILAGMELPPIKIETDREFYDYAAKYQDDNTRFLLPSGLSPEDEAEIKAVARHAFDVLGCKGWGRVDVMRDNRSGEFRVLEVNTVPGLTSHSLVPRSAAAEGVSFPELIGKIVNAALVES